MDYQRRRKLCERIVFLGGCVLRNGERVKETSGCAEGGGRRRKRKRERKENGDAETDRSKCSVKREPCILISLRCQLSCVTQKAILCRRSELGERVPSSMLRAEWASRIVAHFLSWLNLAVLETYYSRIVHVLLMKCSRIFCAFKNAKNAKDTHST